MKQSQLHVITLGACLLGVAPCFADSWEISQSVDISSDTTLTQSGGTNSTQAINAVNLGSSSNVKGTQSVTTNGHTLYLSQSGDNQKQAANLIIAGNITPSTGQIVSTGDLSLQGSGNNNLQALNMAISSNTGGLSQNVTVANNSNFTLDASSNNCIQAGNYLEAASITANSSQTFTGNSINFTDGETVN